MKIPTMNKRRRRLAKQHRKDRKFALLLASPEWAIFTKAMGDMAQLMNQLADKVEGLLLPRNGTP